MKKDTLRLTIIALAAWVVYCVVVFAVPMVKNTVFWFSFAFTLLAFGIAVYSIYVAFIRKRDAKSRFYGFPIARIGVIYGLAQMVVSVVFMTLSTYIIWWVAMLIYVFGFAVTLIGLVSVDAVVEQIQQQDDKLKKNVAFMRGLQAQVGAMTARCEDAQVADAIKALAEELLYSDPVSTEAIREAEERLSVAVEALNVAVTKGNVGECKQLSKQASAILAERNRLCKLNKG